MKTAGFSRKFALIFVMLIMVSFVYAKYNYDSFDWENGDLSKIPKEIRADEIITAANFGDIDLAADTRLSIDDKKALFPELNLKTKEVVLANSDAEFLKALKPELQNFIKERYNVEISLLGDMEDYDEETGTFIPSGEKATVFTADDIKILEKQGYSDFRVMPNGELSFSKNNDPVTISNGKFEEIGGGLVTEPDMLRVISGEIKLSNFPNEVKVLEKSDIIYKFNKDGVLEINTFNSKVKLPNGHSLVKGTAILNSPTHVTYVPVDGRVSFSWSNQDINYDVTGTTDYFDDSKDHSDNVNSYIRSDIGFRPEINNLKIVPKDGHQILIEYQTIDLRDFPYHLIDVDSRDGVVQFNSRHFEGSGVLQGQEHYKILFENGEVKRQGGAFLYSITSTNKEGELEYLYGKNKGLCKGFEKCVSLTIDIESRRGLTEDNIAKLDSELYSEDFQTKLNAARELSKLGIADGNMNNRMLQIVEEGIRSEDENTVKNSLNILLNGKTLNAYEPVRSALAEGNIQTARILMETPEYRKLVRKILDGAYWDKKTILADEEYLSLLESPAEYKKRFGGEPSPSFEDQISDIRNELRELRESPFINVNEYMGAFFKIRTPETLTFIEELIYDKSQYTGFNLDFATEFKGERIDLVRELGRSRTNKESIRRELESALKLEEDNDMMDQDMIRELVNALNILSGFLMVLP